MSTRPVLTLVEVRKALGNLSRSALYELIGRGEFPSSLSVGKRSVWLEADVLWFFHGQEIASRLKKDESRSVPIRPDPSGLANSGDEGIEKRKPRG